MLFWKNVYLQDTSVNLYGLNIFGSPWTNSGRMGFSAPNDLFEKWKGISTNTDIVLTHMPIFGILDRACRKTYNYPGKCKTCNKFHQR